MSKISENSSNMNDITIESEIKLNSIFTKITSIYNRNFKNNIFKRRQINPIKLKKKNNLSNFISDNLNLNLSKSTTNQSEENKTKLCLKENKKNQVNSLFNNSLLREKQKRFRLSSISLKNYHIYLDCDKPKKIYNIVDNNYKMFHAFLSRTKSNFNNKYNIIYSISNWKKKEKINQLFNSIKKYQNKYNFSNYLENQMSKRSISAKRIKLKNNLNYRINNNKLSKILLISQTNNYLENISHKNNLIKIKTNNFTSRNPPFQIKRNNTIFDSNNIFFKTVPLKNKI